MTMPTDLYRRLIATIRLNAATYQHILAGISQSDAATYRDGGDGWTALEVVGHVYDFDGIFLARAKRILAEENPSLTPYDHDQLVIDGAYNRRDKDDLGAALVASRADMAAFFEGLHDADWLRAGMHPERETPFKLSDALLQVATHDATHLEQITRLLSARES